MNNVIKFSIILLLFSSLPLFAQDVQEIYEEAKTALTQGDYQTAQLKVSIAQVMIEKDPNLDPNGNFTKRLLPKVEEAANKMESVVKALVELNAQSPDSLFKSDFSSSGKSVEAYSQQAKNAGKMYLAKRDSIMNLYDLDPEYQTALQNLPVYQKAETFASEDVVDHLSQEFSTMTASLTDSLNNLNTQYNALVSNIERLKKSATVNKAEKEKLEKELARISEERLNYLNSLSEMLMGERSDEHPEMQGKYLEKQVDNIFADVIHSEIKRIQGLTEADSATYKDLIKNYERIKNYNQIFLKNNITSDQSDLLAQYERAIAGLNVEKPAKFQLPWMIIVALAIVIIILIIVVLNRKRVENNPGSTSG